MLIGGEYASLDKIMQRNRDELFPGIRRNNATGVTVQGIVPASRSNTAPTATFQLIPGNVIGTARAVTSKVPGRTAAGLVDGGAGSSRIARARTIRIRRIALCHRGNVGGTQQGSGEALAAERWLSPPFRLHSTRISHKGINPGDRPVRFTAEMAI